MRALSLQPIDTGSAPKPLPAGRTCIACSSVLSRFNPDDACRLCEQRAKRLRIRCDELPTHTTKGNQ